MKRRVTTTVLSPRDRNGFPAPAGRIVIHEQWNDYASGWGYYAQEVTLSFAWLRNHPARYDFAA